MKKLSALIILLSSTAICPAEDLTVDGVTYKDFRWGTVTPYEVGVIYSGGITSVPLEKLPPELQKRFGYDPQRAAAYRQAGAEQAAYRQETMGKFWFEGKIVFGSKLGYVRVTGWLVNKGLYSIRTGVRVKHSRTTYAPGSVDTTVESGDAVDTFEGSIVDLGCDTQADLWRVDAGRGTGPWAYRPGKHVQGGEQVIVKYPLDVSIGDPVDFYPVRVGSIGGRQTYAVPTPISFEDWQRHRAEILAVHH